MEIDGEKAGKYATKVSVTLSNLESDQGSGWEDYLCKLKSNIRLVSFWSIYHAGIVKGKAGAS